MDLDKALDILDRAKDLKPECMPVKDIMYYTNSVIDFARNLEPLVNKYLGGSDKSMTFLMRIPKGGLFDD